MKPEYDDVLYDLGDAELVEEWRQARLEFQRARMRYQKSEGELVRRMGEALALETEAGTVVRSPQLGEYQWDEAALRRLFGTRLVEAQWRDILHEVRTVKVKTATVQKYARQLHIPEADLNACYFRAERKQDLEWHPPQNLKAQLEASIALKEGVR